MITTNRRHYSAKLIAAVNCLATIRYCLRRIPSTFWAAAALLLALASIESLPGFMAYAEQPVNDVAHPAQTHDTGERKRPSIVNNSSDGPTIHFTSCRENDKQHVSCSFVDAAGEQHWVYLAGYKLPAAK